MTKTVVRPLPFHCTVDVLRKLAPFTVSVNAAPPAATDCGVTDVSVGPAIVNVAAAEVPGFTHCAGFWTCTDAVPAAASRFAGTVAKASEVDWTVVASAAPFHKTTLGGDTQKKVPATCRAEVLARPGVPAGTDEGVKPVIAGAPVTVKVAPPETAVAVLVTVIVATAG